MTDSAQQPDSSSVTAQLKELVKDISKFIEHASEDQQETLLELLGDWRILSLLETSKLADQRQYSRKPCSMAVNCATQDRVFKDFIRNISTGGAFIETRAPLSVGQEVTVTFLSPNDKEPIKVSGEIVRCDSQGIALKFKTPGEHLEAMILSL